MLRLIPGTLPLIVFTALSLTACGNEAADTNVAANGKTAAKYAEPNATSPGKPSAPVSIDYEILGKAIVGVPVSINVRVRGTRDDLGPVSLSYSINDRSSLRFQDGQVERLEIPDLHDASVKQLAVVPQREGRLYVNVAVEVETAGGSMIKSMAIPIQVGSAPESTRNDGEVKQGPDGELVQSMPAREN